MTFGSWAAVVFEVLSARTGDIGVLEGFDACTAVDEVYVSGRLS